MAQNASQTQRPGGNWWPFVVQHPCRRRTLRPAHDAPAQASDAELRHALAECHALCLDSRWRAVQPAYLGHVLELLLLTAAERGWPLDALDGAEAPAALRAEGNVDPR